MRKIIAFLLIAISLSFSNIVCQAETLLTYYNTVEIKPFFDISKIPEASIENEIADFAENKSSLKNIMRGAANTFFQK